MNNICQICDGITTSLNLWTLRLSDERESVEIKGCRDCINKLETRINEIDKDGKKSVKFILSKIKLNI